MYLNPSGKRSWSRQKVLRAGQIARASAASVERTKTKIIVPHSPMTVPELPELAPLRRPIIGNLRREYADGIRRYAQTGDEEKSALLRQVGIDRS